MPKYRVDLVATASTTVEVEAEDKDAALEAAFAKSMPTICAQCSGWGGRQNLDLSDDWDIPPGWSIDKAVEEIRD